MTGIFDWSAAFQALGWIALAASATWVVSLLRRDVSIVDSLWALMIALGGWAYALEADPIGPREALVLGLTSLWALRLSGHITWRNWGHGEDRRYQAIRARNQPRFEWKSLYLVFGLQAVLAWIVSLPLMAALAGGTPLGWLDGLGFGLWLFGIAHEAVADWQLARFKADPANAGQVMDRGLWRYSRHPNYFGEFCVWWGAWLVALAGGGSWTVVSPLLMTLLLLKVSGVALLEQDIGEHRPAYQDYIARTSAFIPWPPRRGWPSGRGEGMRWGLLVLVGLALGAIVGIAAASTATHTTLRFNVLLDGDPIGQHRFELRGSGPTREVVIQADFRVRLLLLDVYRYRHTATERWLGDCLETLSARTDDNGKIETVTARRSGDGLVVDATRAQGRHGGCVRSFAYWNPRILDGGRLLNAQTGAYMPIRVLPLGEERVPVRGRLESTRRYRLIGEGVEIDLWYAGEDWVALESRAGAGRRLRYELL
jgi:steroid 5-alpha reductase family enzyme